MNSRTGTLLDYIENDNSYHMPLPDEYVEDGSMSDRANMDGVVNVQGRNLIEFCRMCNLRILNGRHGADKGVGRFTCYTYNGMSCVDYVLCSPELMPVVNEFSSVYGAPSGTYLILFTKFIFVNKIEFCFISLSILSTKMKLFTFVDKSETVCK